LRVIKEVKIIEKVLGEFNSIFFALIPKKDKPEGFHEFNHISLCKCLYKIITEVLEFRVKMLISEVIL
jgi:hypothetical protein